MLEKLPTYRPHRFLLREPNPNLKWDDPERDRIFVQGLFSIVYPCFLYLITNPAFLYVYLDYSQYLFLSEDTPFSIEQEELEDGCKECINYDGWIKSAVYQYFADTDWERFARSFIPGMAQMIASILWLRDNKKKTPKLIVNIDRDFGSNIWCYILKRYLRINYPILYHHKLKFFYGGWSIDYMNTTDPGKAIEIPANKV